MKQYLELMRTVLEKGTDRSDRTGVGTRSMKEMGVRIWDSWADENGELGPVYGHQWRRWSAPIPEPPRPGPTAVDPAAPAAAR